MKIRNMKHFLEVLRFAVENGCVDSLTTALERVNGWKDAEIFPDFAPNSFTFSCDEPWAHGGGIIFHADDKKWSIHT
jgi:hypothetical protein